jgi:hypothetical protein
MDVMWQNIPWLVREYSITSFNNINVANEYSKNIQ